jgi:hypothetical protein
MGEHTSRWLSKTLGWVAAVLMLGCGIDVVVNAVHG